MSKKLRITSTSKVDGVTFGRGVRVVEEYYARQLINAGAATEIVDQATVVEDESEVEDLSNLKRHELLKMAKSKGLSVSMLTTKVELLELLANK